MCERERPKEHARDRVMEHLPINFVHRVKVFAIEFAFIKKIILSKTFNITFIS